MSSCQCGPRTPLTPLELFARSLHGADEEAPMRFPMYTVPLQDLLQMESLEPHETLKAKGILIEFDSRKGNGLQRHTNGSNCTRTPLRKQGGR